MPLTEILNTNFEEFVYSFESENGTTLYVGKFCGNFKTLIKNYTRDNIPDSQSTHVRINKEMIKFLSENNRILVKTLRQDKANLIKTRDTIKLKLNPIWAKK